MEKKPNLKKIHDEEIPDEVLLNEDLEDDDLLSEAQMLLGSVPTKQSRKKSRIKESYQSESIPNMEKEPGNHQEKKKLDKTSQKPIINKDTMIKFSRFLTQKAEIYEEISFATILRKIPPQWNYDIPILIDILEVLIENNMVANYRMKMTANSLKFYPSHSNINKKR